MLVTQKFRPRTTFPKSASGKRENGREKSRTVEVRFYKENRILGCGGGLAEGEGREMKDGSRCLVNICISRCRWKNIRRCICEAAREEGERWFHLHYAHSLFCRAPPTAFPSSRLPHHFVFQSPFFVYSSLFGVRVTVFFCISNCMKSNTV